MAMSTYLRRAALNHLFRTAALTKPTFLYAALLTTDPTPGDVGTEVSTSGTGYARQPIAVEDASWSAPADAAEYKEVHNLLSVTFDPPADLWGTPAYWGLYDQVTGGNLWYFGSIQGTLRLVDVTSDPVSFAPQALSISMGQASSDYLETAWLNYTLRSATLAKPANVYAALHSADPTDLGGVGEFTGTAYSRVPIAVADASWSDPVTLGDSEIIYNSGVIQFPVPGADWGTYYYSSLNDAASGGNMLIVAANEVGRIVNAFDNPPTWLPGEFQLSWS